MSGELLAIDRFAPLDRQPKGPPRLLQLGRIDPGVGGDMLEGQPALRAQSALEREQRQPILRVCSEKIVLFAAQPEKLLDQGFPRSARWLIEALEQLFETGGIRLVGYHTPDCGAADDPAVSGMDMSLAVGEESPALRCAGSRAPQAATARPEPQRPAVSSA